MTTYEYAGLTEELHQRLADEFNTLKTKHNRTFTKYILEGLLSRELFGEIAKYVFNHYEWPESLDSEVDRINLEYRSKGELGRNKTSVRKALYTAYALGV